MKEAFFLLSKKTLKQTIILAFIGASFAHAPMMFAQEGLSKTPNLSKEVAAITPVDEVVMPQGYPTELDELTPDIRSYVVVDQETNRILMARQANTPYPIASMSKVPAVYMVYKAIEEGKLSLDQKIKVPAEIVEHLSNNPELSSAYLKTDVEYPVKDLIYSVMMESGNDATSALLWHIYGSEQAAVQAIRDQLTEWGLTNFEFYITSGAPNQYLPESMWMPGSTASDENKMSAADMALVAQYVVEKYPQILEVTSSKEYVFMKGTDHERTLFTPIALLEGGEYGRPGVTGLKSGLTDAAGKNFVTTTTENGRKLISVVMGIKPEFSSYQETGILLDGLAKHPDLYKLEGLSSNRIPTLAERQAEEASLAAQNASSNEQSDKAHIPQYENKRDSFLTNLMRSIFGFFN